MLSQAQPMRPELGLFPGAQGKEGLFPCRGGADCLCPYQVREADLRRKPTGNQRIRELTWVAPSWDGDVPDIHLQAFPKPEPIKILLYLSLSELGLS